MASSSSPVNGSRFRGARMVRDMAAYHLFRLSRNIAALHDFPSANTFQERVVKIRAGYDIAFQCPQAVPMVLMLTTHPTRDGDIIGDQTKHFSPGVKSRDFLILLAIFVRDWLPRQVYWRSAASSSSRTVVCPMRCAQTRGNGLSAICRMMSCRSC